MRFNVNPASALLTTVDGNTGVDRIVVNLSNAVDAVVMRPLLVDPVRGLVGGFDVGGQLKIDIVDVELLTVSGGSAADFLIGFNFDDVLGGGDGDDSIDGGLGQDRLVGGPGDDQMLGGSGDDLVEGREDDDGIDGGPGNDVLVGGAGADRLSAGAGADWMQGDDGADFLAGEADQGGDGSIDVNIQVNGAIVASDVLYAF